MSRRPFFRFLDTIGDGSGTKDVSENYLATSEVFYFTHPSTAPTQCFIERMLIHYRTTANISAAQYGHGSELVNGISVKHLDADLNVLDDLTDDDPVTTNASWGQFCYDIFLTEFGQGHEFFNARWTFGRSGEPLELKPGESLALFANDDFSSRVIKQTFNIQGTC